MKFNIQINIRGLADYWDLEWLNLTYVAFVFSIKHFYDNIVKHYEKTFKFTRSLNLKKLLLISAHLPIKFNLKKIRIQNQSIALVHQVFFENISQK